MITDLDQVRQLVAIDADGATRSAVIEALASSRSLLQGHFALHRGRHATTALRFRGLGHDPAALRVIAKALVTPDWDLRGTVLLSPESSGFFLADALARMHGGLPHAIAQTDLRRMPTRTLLSGAIQPNDRVVIVNDVANSGASVDVLRELIVERGAFAHGVLVFGVVGVTEFHAYCDRWKLPRRHLLTANWQLFTPEVDCPGCARREPAIPIAEFV